MNVSVLNIRKGNTVIYIFALLASLLISFGVEQRNAVINPDGICYLLSAQIVGFSSLKDVMHLCPQAQWPFYSILIYNVVKISHLSYHAAATLLNTFFSLISVVTFILIINELGGTRRILWLAAVVILCDHQFNILRDNIIRDHGFWAFYLLSMYFLLCYFRERKLPLALGWSASILIATLFRIEGVVFLIALPFVSAFYPCKFKERFKAFFILNLPTILICIILCIWFLSHPQQSLNKLGRLGEITNQVHHGFFLFLDKFHAAKFAMIQYVLPPDSSSDAVVALLFMWLGIYLYNIVLTLSWGYVAVLLYACKNRVISFTACATPVVWAYLLINIIITSMFLAEHLFISKRYLIALTLVLLLWMPFVLDELIKRSNNFRHRIFLGGISIVILISAISSVVQFGYSKLYIRSAGDWLAYNVPANATLYANDIQLMYYTKHFDTQIFNAIKNNVTINPIANEAWRKYDYLALRLGKSGDGDVTDVLQKVASLTPIKIFSSKRGNRVAIYQIPKEEK